jgi:hypothetical protein
LLLLSKSRIFPTGIGNRHDWVGRNLQGHVYTGATGFFERETYDDLGPGACIAISDYSHGNAGLTGGGMLANEFIRLPIQLDPKVKDDWGIPVLRLSGDKHPHSIEIGNHQATKA